MTARAPNFGVSPAQKPRAAMTFLSLFSGIGGLELGLERAGMRCIGQVEIDPYCRRVLAKHWPDVPKFDDVRTFKAGMLNENPDLICGGFPCQGISSANYRGEGLADDRSGLWFDYLRLIREFRPRFVVAENVTALTFRGLERVLCDLAESGLDAEWQTVSAQMLGAPHERERIFIVAYPTSKRRQADEIFARSAFKTASEKQAARIREWPGQRQHSSTLPDRIRWCPDSSICRVADGLPDELDRYRALGNAVVPQVAQFIGERIMEAHNASND